MVAVCELLGGQHLRWSITLLLAGDLHFLAETDFTGLSRPADEWQRMLYVADAKRSGSQEGLRSGGKLVARSAQLFR